jgi:hypothetical protein
MTKNEKNIITDEGGLFVFGPWWFVILIMAVVFIASLFKSNNKSNDSTNQVFDYKNTRMLNKPLRIICPHCKMTNLKSAKFCTECGCSLSQRKGIFCPNCGTKNTNESQFCLECGKKL